MEIPQPSGLIGRVRALPAAAPLLERLPDDADVHLVGGAVRDLLLGGTPYDLDLVTEGEAAALARALDERAQVHDRFGTSTFTLDGFTYDIARTRRETYSSPGALPDVCPATLSEDLLRRDFTVNAAAIGLTGEEQGMLTSAPGALEDLDARRLRVIHDVSFIDDPTRLLRLARYASRLQDFAIEPHTQRLARAAVNEGALGTVSGPRIGNEVRLAAREHDPIAALTRLRELGLDHAIHPGFGLTDPRLAHRAVQLLPDDARGDLLVLGAAGMGMEAAELRALLDSLAFEAGDRDVILAVSGARRLAADIEAAGRASEIAAAVAQAPSEAVALAGALGPADDARQWLTRLRHVGLEIDGADLIAAGVPEGPAIGKGLRAALAAKLDADIGGREEELARALRAARGDE